MMNKIKKSVASVICFIMIMGIIPFEHVSAASVVKWIGNPVTCEDIYYCDQFDIWTMDWDKYYGTNRAKGFINEEGKMIYDENNYMTYFNSSVIIKEDENGNKGIIDMDNNTIVPFQYESIYYNSDSVIEAKIENELIEEKSYEVGDDKWGIVDISNNVIIPFIYKSINYKSDSCIVVKDESDKTGIIDINNNVIVPFIYKSIDYKSDSCIVVKGENDKLSIIDINNNVVVPFIYKSINYKSDSCIEVWDENGKWGIIDINNNVVVPFIYKSIDYKSDSCIVVQDENDKLGIIDINNNVVVPFIYKSIDYKSDSCIEVWDENGKCGIIDINNNVVVPFIYEYINYKSDSRIEVEDENGKCGIIDINGNIVIPCVYDDIMYYSDSFIKFQIFTYIAAFIIGFTDINNNGKEIPMEYSSLHYLSDSCIIATKDDYSNYGLIDTNNNILIPFNEYKNIRMDSKGIYGYISKDEYDNGKKRTYYKIKIEDMKPSGENEFVLNIGNQYASVWGEIKANDVVPVIRNDRTMLPARFVAENLGAEVGWNDAEKKVTIKKDNTTIELTINSDTAYVNGEVIKIDSAAVIENSRTYVPVRFIAENLGAEVKWIEDTKSVVMKNKDA